MPASSKKDPDSPATTSYAYDIMCPRWAKIDALLGGTETMRAAGREYLPQHCEESDRAYRNRLNTAVLLNMTEMTLTSLVSRPFSSPITKTDVDPKIEALLADVDLQGTSLDRFARHWFRMGVAKAFASVLVEFPHLDPDALRTKEDDQRDNLRPYLVFIAPENVLDVDEEVIDGKRVLKQVRILEVVVERVGYAQVTVEQIRVLTPGSGEIYRQKKSKNGKIEWMLYRKYDVDLGFIPFETFYADRQDTMLGKPPLTDLGDLNIKHWQGSADQNAVLTVARFPMLAVSGAIDTDTVVVGPNNLLSVTDPQGRFYYVEHTGKAIAAGRQDLLDLVEDMAGYGATFLQKRPGGETATSRALDSAEVTSALQDMAMGFQDSLNNVMWMMGQWLGVNNVGKFGVKTDFGLTDQQSDNLAALRDARKLVPSDLSRSQYLQGLKRFGVLPEEFDIKANEGELENETVLDINAKGGTDGGSTSGSVR